MLIFNDKETEKAKQKCLNCKFVFYCENIEMFISNKLKETIYVNFNFNPNRIYLHCPIKKFVLFTPGENQIRNIRPSKRQ